MIKYIQNYTRIYPAVRLTDDVRHDLDFQIEIALSTWIWFRARTIHKFYTNQVWRFESAYPISFFARTDSSYFCYVSLPKVVEDGVCGFLVRRDDIREDREEEHD
jgi:hypothetical protein